MLSSDDRPRSPFLFRLLTLGLLILLPAASRAAIHTVTSLADSGPGTLRAALEAAGEGDTVVFDADLIAAEGPHFLHLEQGPLLLRRSLEIVGPGDGPDGRRAKLVIMGTGSHRILEIEPERGRNEGIQVSLSGLGFEGGFNRQRGGGFFIGSRARVLLQACDFRAHATHRDGGAIYNAGVLEIDLSRFEANASRSDGGAIFNAGELTVTRSLFTGNESWHTGGAITSVGPYLWIEGSTFSANEASAGGAIALLPRGGRATEGTVIASTVSYNHARLVGGGLYTRGAQTTLDLGHSIVSRNTARPKRGFIPDDAAAWFSSRIQSLGFNLMGGSLFWYAQDETDVLGEDPRLQPLAWTGGRTETHALEPDSPAIDAGDPDFDGILVDTDQRGFPRRAPFPDGPSDLGAHELQPPSMSCPEEVVFACAGEVTEVVLEAQLWVPDGGEAEVRWVLDGVSRASETVLCPPGEPVLLTFPALLPRGETHIEIAVEANGYELICTGRAIVVDELPPVISLLGPSPLVLACGSEYVEPGARAIDACEGPLPVAVDRSGLNLAQPGIYTIRYMAQDSAGLVAEALRFVEVVDEDPPRLLGEVPDSIQLEPGSGADCLAVLAEVPFPVWAEDGCDPSPEVLFHRLDRDGTRTPLAFPASFPLGLSTIEVQARDAEGNRSLPEVFTVEVIDRAPPILELVGEAEVTLPLGSPFPDPGVEASDGCSGPVEVLTFVSGPAGDVFDPCLPGVYTIEYTAFDAAGNTASQTRQVTVLAEVAFSGAVDVVLPVEPAECSTTLEMAALFAVEGLPDDCRDHIEVRAFVTTRDGTVHERSSDESFAFPVGMSTVTAKATLLPDVGPAVELAEASFTVRIEDPFYACVPNVIWPLALPLNTPVVDDSSGLRGVTFQQVLTKPGEARWYRFPAPPGGQVRVFLENLPADYNLVVYGDVEESYDELLSQIESDSEEAQLLALLGAEFAPEAYAPEAYSPEAYAPEAYAPEAYAPEAYAPEAYAPEAYAPEAYAPEAYAPEAYAPEAYAPEAYAPEAYAPEAYAPEAYAPEAYAPEAYAPEAYAPEAYAPEAYAAAQQRSLISFSAAPGTAGEAVVFNTFSRAGTIYVRVKGRHGIADPEEPFTLLVEIRPGVCEGVDDTDTTSVSTPVVSGSPTSLLVWDSTRIPGSIAEVSALSAALDAFAAAANGVVLDVGLDLRVAALNAQADAHPACPFAKNLVAEAIRERILAFRSAAPSIADITLLGSDEVMPFFRTNDEAGLASEANYFPPVFDNTHSQSSLRLAQVLTQDRYGSRCRIYLSTGAYDLPEVPVGRVVETAAEAAAYLDTYRVLFDGTVASDGVLPVPQSALAVGYDFLADSAEALRTEFTAGLGAGATVNELIVSIDVPPALGWTADDLRAAFLGSSHDLVYLAGHFSTSGALAADYATRLSAGEVAAATTDLTHALILSSGCHSGYNTVDAAAIPFVTEQPDWAQAFSRKGALWLSGTGYQYGDTDFIEYTERLQLEFVRALRAGSGPVPIGRALVEAKRTYLQDTALMRGIHEKTLLQLTLYGLPMMKVNLPGTRLVESGEDAVPLVLEPLPGPGTAFGLKRGSLTVEPVLLRVDRTLEVVGTEADTVVASYWEGSDGVVSLPGEPVRARETYRIGRPLDGLVRGLGFRGGTYVDLPDFRPLTGAPATETRGVHGAFRSEVFYPQRPWNLNVIGELCALEGETLLNVFPIQYISPDLESNLGVARRFDRMDLEVFYSPVVSVETLSSPPSINRVSSDYEDGVVQFAVEVAVAGEVGVQQVWITYTGLPGSPYHGEWTSLDLTAPTDPLQAGVWTATLPLSPGTDPAAFRFLVQVVNASGATTFNANFGRFFKLDASTLDGVGVVASDTVLELAVDDSTPVSGPYRGSLPVGATLQDTFGTPLAGKTVVFRLGPVELPRTTDAAGVASGLLHLDAAPGTYRLEASFRGDENQEPASDTRPFTIEKAPTRLELIPTDEGTGIAALLEAVDGTPLKERSVLFVLSGNGQFDALSVITDGGGLAVLQPPDLPPGIYTVQAYFGQPVEILEGTVVPLTDPLYGPSEDSGSVALGDRLALEPMAATAVYNDSFTNGAYPGNLGLSSVTLTASFILPRPGDSLAELTGNGSDLVLSVEASLADGIQVSGSIPLSFRETGGWSGKNDLGTVLAYGELQGDASGTAGTVQLNLRFKRGEGPLFAAEPAAIRLRLRLAGPQTADPPSGELILGGTSTAWSEHLSPDAQERSFED